MAQSVLDQVRSHLGEQLSVADTGAGIPAGDRERVLEPFVRLDASRSTPGSGLGLALVSAVARLHGATLRLVDAAPGLKVTVSFSLTPEAGILGFSNTQDISRSPAQA